MKSLEVTILYSIAKAIEDLPAHKLEFLRGYAEGLIARRDSLQDDNKKAG